MKLQMFKLIALIALFIGLFSCTKEEDDPNGFQWDDSKQQEEFRPVDQGKKSSYFKIDNNIISFAVPYLVGTRVIEYPPGTVEGYNIWSINLIMAKGIDVSKLAPVITLAPGATITRIEWIKNNENPPKPEYYGSIDVDYTGIAEVGEYNFKYQIDFIVRAPDGSIVKYKCSAVAIGDVLPCTDCP